MKQNYAKQLWAWFHIIMGILTATVGYTIHHSGFWAVVDFFFWPIAIIKWIVCQQINLSILQETFSWFLR